MGTKLGTERGGRKVRAVAFVLRLECDRPDCENVVEVAIEPDETPREVVAAVGWSLVRLGDSEVLRCPEHPLRAGLIPSTAG